MNLTFNVEHLLLPVSIDLQEKLSSLANEEGVASTTTAVVFNFRETNYSAEEGGWHPVEIRIEQTQGQWAFSYITDFAYCGGAFPELVKEVDFCFDSGVAHFSYVPELPIASSEVMEFYSIWESNFLSYIDMDVFDEIKVTLY